MTTAAVLDGAVITPMLCPANAVTIRDHLTVVCVCRTYTFGLKAILVWDVYSKTSLKSETREQTGSGAGRQVTFSTKSPSNWAAFSRVDLNKQEFFVDLEKKEH